VPIVPGKGEKTFKGECNLRERKTDRRLDNCLILAAAVQRSRTETTVGKKKKA